uniref:Putative secreted protein n=1 Tax=Ixodes ricinus TaxID=34613 RepID=A0A6B0UM58_IXORI
MSGPLIAGFSFLGRLAAGALARRFVAGTLAATREESSMTTVGSMQATSGTNLRLRMPFVRAGARGFEFCSVTGTRGDCTRSITSTTCAAAFVALDVFLGFAIFAVLVAAFPFVGVGT